MLKKAILIVTAATFAPTGSFADDHGPFEISYNYLAANTLYKAVVDNAFFGLVFELAEYGENYSTILAGSAEAKTPLDGGKGPINGTCGFLMFVTDVSGVSYDACSR